MNYNWHHIGDKTLALLDFLGVQKAYIVGLDWGALISSVMVVDHPERFLCYVRMEADLDYTPGQSLEKLYELKSQWKPPPGHREGDRAAPRRAAGHRRLLPAPH